MFSDLVTLLTPTVWTVFFGGVLILWLAALSIIDLKTYRLPNTLTFSLIGLGLLQASILTGALRPHLIGAVLGYGFFVAIEYAFRRIRGIDGLGRGDAKLLAAGGAWCGWMGLSYIVLIGSLFGIIAALMPIFKKSPKGWIPFGPFLAVGIFIVWSAQKLATI